MHIGNIGKMTCRMLWLPCLAAASTHTILVITLH